MKGLSWVAFGNLLVIASFLAFSVMNPDKGFDAWPIMALGLFIASVFCNDRSIFTTFDLFICAIFVPGFSWIVIINRFKRIADPNTHAISSLLCGMGIYAAMTKLTFMESGDWQTAAIYGTVAVLIQYLIALATLAFLSIKAPVPS